jgi:hypothetical protein
MENQVSFEDIERLNRETDRRLAEQMEASRAEFDRRLKELGKQIGGLGNRLGEFVEGMVRPGLVRLFRERGIDLNLTIRDLSARRDGEAAQIDLMAIDDTDAVAVEVKSRLRVEDVDDHLRRMEKFRRLFPRFADLRVMAAVAGMVIDDEAVTHAEANGVFVIGQAGDDAVLLNSAGFEPKAW